MTPKTDIVTSKLPSSKGRLCASASTKSTSSRSAVARSRPRSSSAGTKSAPVVLLQVRRAAAMAPLPLPQATSRTRSSGMSCRAAARVSETGTTRWATSLKSPFDHIVCWAAVAVLKSGASLIPPTLSREEAFGYLQHPEVDLLDLDRLLKRNRGHRAAVEGRHAAEVACFGELVGLGAVEGGEDAVGRGGGAAALDVAEHGHSRLVAGQLLELARQGGADPAEARVAVFVALLDRLDQPLFAALEGELGALGDDDDREVLTAVMTAGDVAADFLDRGDLLGDDDAVGAAGEAGVSGDPAGVPAHHLDHHDPVVGLGGGVEAVDRVGDYLHCGVEAEGEVGAADVVVDRLRDTDQRQAVIGMELPGDLHRVLAADRDDGVKPLLLEGGGDFAHRALADRLEARGAEDRPALVEDPGDPEHIQRHVVVLGEPLVAAADPDRLVALLDRRAGDGADRGVEAGTVSSCGQDSDAHRASLGGIGLGSTLMSRLLVVPVLVLLVALASGCGEEGAAGGATVTVYVSAPLRGAEAEAGQRLCDEARERAGQGRGGEELRLRVVCLDASEGERAWTLAQVGANARRAIEDSTAVAYVGEPDSEARRQSRPIVAAAGIAQLGGMTGREAVEKVRAAIAEGDESEPRQAVFAAEG